MSNLMGSKYWTPARYAALDAVATGEVVRVYPEGRNPYFTVRPWWQRPRQAPYQWLLARGYIRVSSSYDAGASVHLTSLGKEAQEGRVWETSPRG